MAGFFLCDITGNVDVQCEDMYVEGRALLKVPQLNCDSDKLGEGGL